MGISVQNPGPPAGCLTAPAPPSTHSTCQASPGGAPGPLREGGAAVGGGGELSPGQAVRTGGWLDTVLQGPAPAGSDSFKERSLQATPSRDRTHLPLA